MDNRYIAVFDSGLGGLTVVKELMHLMPNEAIVYLGDTGRVPYGNKSQETIVKYTKGDISFLKTFNPKAIVIACGTASSLALPIIKDSLTIPTYGVVEPAVKAAINATENKKIGIIGTQGTISSKAYALLINKLDRNISTVSRACPMFVPLVENGYLSGTVTETIAAEYLTPMLDEGVDTLIMGCTHYPLLKDTIRKIMGDKVTLIDPGQQTAIFIKNLLNENDMQSDNTPKSNHKFFVSDWPQSFAKLGSTFLEREITAEIEKVDIEKYTEQENTYEK